MKKSNQKTSMQITPEDKFSTFNNNILSLFHTRSIVGGEAPQPPVSEESEDFIIEDIVDM